MFLPLLVEGRGVRLCRAWGRVTATEGARSRNAHPTPSHCRGGCTRDSLPVGDDDSFYYRWNHSLIAPSSVASLFLSSPCAAAEAECRHSAVASPCYLPVSVKNVGGREDGGGTELVSEAAGAEMLLASRRLLAAGPGQPAPSSRVTQLVETEQRSPGQKDARHAGTRPAPSASIRSPDPGSPGTILVSPARLPLALGIVFLTSLTL